MRIPHTGHQYYDLVFIPLDVPYVLFPSISFMSTICALLVCIGTKLYRKPVGRMIIFFLLSSCLSDSVKFFGSIFFPQSAITCRISDMIFRFGMLSTAIGGSLFAHALHRVSKYKLISLNSIVKVYFAVTVLIASVLTLASSQTDLVQFKDGECLQQIDQKAIDLNYLFITAIPLLGCCILTIFWYALSAQSIIRVINEERNKYLLTLICYPILSVLCWFPLSALYFWMSITNYKGAFLAAPLEAFCQFQGCLNSLVYGVTLLRPFKYCFKWEIVILKDIEQSLTSKSQSQSLASLISDRNAHPFATEVSSIRNYTLSNSNRHSSGGTSYI